MRIVIVQNPDAGPEEVPGEQIEAPIAEAGHEVVYRSTKEAGWRTALREPADLYVAAGGDGTIRKVLTELAGTDTTVALIPLGTANNIARSLGVPLDDPAAGMAAWTSMHPDDSRLFDVPLVESPTGRSRFVESVGFGLFAELVVTADREQARGSSGGGLDDAVRLLREMLRRRPRPRRWSVFLDDEDLSGAYVAVEAMNIGGVGPRVCLAPEADPGDGLLDLVMIEEGHLAELADRVDALDGDHLSDCRATSLRSHRGRHLRIRGPSDAALHVDDRSVGRRRALDDTRLEVRMDGVGVNVLASGGRSVPDELAAW